MDVEKLTGIVILDVLAELHSHPRDNDLLFRDVDHSYTWRGQRVSLSVTGLIHSLAQSFNPTAALAAMHRGKNWPRPEYVAHNMVQELQRLLEGDVSTTVELMHLLSGREVDVAAVCRRLRDLIWMHPGYEYLATAASLSDAQILAKWERSRRVVAAEGTWLHAKCECLLNGGSVPIASPEICMFLKFVQRFQAEGWTFRRTEWAIYAEAEDLAGSIDAVAERGSDICLVDWKRTKQLLSEDCSFGRHLKYPLQDVPDAGLWHYRVQLNIYAWILRRYYEVVVTDLRIVCLHPDNVFSPLAQSSWRVQGGPSSIQQ